MNLDDFLAGRQSTKILLYGAPKTRKTFLTGQLAKNFKLSLLDLDGGASVLAQLSPEIKKNITYYRIPDDVKNCQAVKLCNKLFVKLASGPICDTHGNLSCPLCKDSPGEKFNLADFEAGKNHILVIDSLSQLTTSILSYILKDEEETENDVTKLTIHHFQAMGRYMHKILTNLQSRNINLVCITQDLDVDKSEKSSHYVPLIGTREFSRTAGKYFDAVIRTDKVAKAFKVYSGGLASTAFESGNRANIEIENLPPSNNPLEVFFKKH